MKNFIKVSLFIMLSVLLCFEPPAVAESNGQCAQVVSVRAAHILVDTKSEADIIKAKIDNGESFEVLAKKYSKCPSGSEGGDLGYFERGQMVKSFEGAAFKMNSGEVSSPVKTQFGWHIIKIYDRK